jgi:tetratricopeptide (TPR) repeat protein
MALPVVSDNYHRGREGVRAVDAGVSRLGLVWRENRDVDFGIDGTIELVTARRATGRLVAAQVKSGPSYFNHDHGDAWHYYPESRHREYWRNHSLPVLVFLHHPETNETYWANAQRALSNGGLFVPMPKSQTLATATPESLFGSSDATHGSYDAASDPQGAFTLPATHQRNPYFVANSDLISELNRSPLGSNCVIYGMGGVGKTQHAVQFAHEARSRFSHVFWVNADTPKLLQESVGALSEFPELGIAGASETDPALKARQIRRWLGGNRGWLLIVDNADSPEAVRAVESFIPAGHTGLVLITTQFAQWSPVFRRLQLLEWPEKDGVRFLEARLVDLELPAEELRRLTMALDGLPLALEHASAFLLQSRVSVSTYLEVFQRHGRLHHEPTAGATDHQRTIEGTWWITARRLAFLQRYLIHIIASLGSAPLPRRVFEFLLPSALKDYTHSGRELRLLRQSVGEPGGVDRALAELSKYSLARVSDSAVQLHPLLQSIVRADPGPSAFRLHFWTLGIVHKIPRKEWRYFLWAKRAANLIEFDGVLPGSIGSHSDMFARREYMPHVEAAVAALPEKYFKRFIFRAHLQGGLEQYEIRMSLYKRGIVQLTERFSENASNNPPLAQETVWFVATVETLYRAVVETKERSDLTYRLESFSKSDKGPEVRDVYGFMRALAKAHLEIGQTEMSRRLFEFGYRQSVADDRAGDVERGAIRIDHAAAFFRTAPETETLELIREGMTHLAGFESYYQFHEGAAMYALLACSPEQLQATLDWLEKAVTHVRPLIPAGYAFGCMVSRLHARALAESGRYDDAIVNANKALALALRAPEAKVKSELALLWELRGRILDAHKQHRRAARSYRRCFEIERHESTVTSRRQAELLARAATSFARAGDADRALRCLAEVEALLVRAVDSNEKIDQRFIDLVTLARSSVAGNE